VFISNTAQYQLLTMIELYLATLPLQPAWRLPLPSHSSPICLGAAGNFESVLSMAERKKEPRFKES
jgi:hypothetical protein